MTFTMNASAAALARIFPDRADIQTPTDTQDDEGGIEQTWTTTHTDVGAQFSPLGGGSTVQDTEVRNGNGDFVNASHICYLQGDFDDISERDECITRGQTFDIVAVHRDSYALVTVLHLEEREPDDDSS